LAKLPMLYLSCDKDALSGPIGEPHLRRLISPDMSVGSVAFITSIAGAKQPEIFHQCGKSSLAEHLQSLMAGREFDVAGSRDPGLEVLAETMIALAPEEVIELRLNTGMTSDSYRQIGRCLEVFRDQGVLLICLDQKETGEGDMTHHQPHDAYFRNLMQQWEYEQVWLQAMSRSSLRGRRNTSARDAPVADPTCVLNTAFSLGGLKAPQRVFGIALNEDSQSLAGYGWMQ
jgi:hypothetical protein